jgi:periplasmic divalent cation tolerance protein
MATGAAQGRAGKRLIRLREGFCLEAMTSARACKLVLVTAPDLRTARRLAQAALKARLIACANLVPGIESHYWWQGRRERGKEVLLLLKTTRARLDRLEKLILAEHPYDTPEFVVLPLDAGNRRYLDWVARSCAGL